MKRQYTPKQYLEAVIRNGGSRVRAAEELNVNIRTLLKNLKQCEARGDVVPPSEYHTNRRDYLVKQVEVAHLAAPAHFHVKGVSTLYGAEGEVKQQWVKTRSDDEQANTDALIKAVKDVFAESEPVPTVPPPDSTDDSLLTIYPIGDAHFGMAAWGEETGDDFDLKIAETDLVTATARLVRSAPKSKYGMVVDVGDYIHVNDKSNRTPASGHLLDADSRYPKIVRVAVRALRSVIELALAQHEIVLVFIRPGNHNPDAYVVLQVALGMLYENNPRVQIEQSPAHYVYHEFGKNLIGVTHGDKCKMEKLGGIMACDMPEAWGRTEFRTWITGHVHSDRKIEGPGWTAESVRTLAAPDAYAKGAGYRSGRDMKAIVLDAEFGEVERHRVDIAQVKKRT